jgi:phosphohistidine phosphatase SixA
MLRRLLVLSFALLFLGPALAAYADEVADPVDQQGLWARLQSGGYIVLLRHAVTEPGVGDPPNFTLGDCSTQRNLSEQGRADAARIGQAFRNHGVAVDAVLSSRWCRCIDTARLAFGRVTPTPYLDSMFGEEEGVRTEKARATFAALGAAPGPGNVVLVTHAQNIAALTGVSPGSGEMVVVRLDGADRFEVLGRIDVPGS